MKIISCPYIFPQNLCKYIEKFSGDCIVVSKLFRKYLRLDKSQAATAFWKMQIEGNSHREFLQLAIALGFNQVKFCSGLCYGVSHKASAFILSGSLDSFDAMIRKIAILFQKLKRRNLSLRQMIETRDLGRFQKIIEEVSPGFYKELFAFFRDIVIMQLPSENFQLFEKSVRPSVYSQWHPKNVETVTSYLSKPVDGIKNVGLGSYHDLYSRCGGLEKLASFTGVYSPEELMQYFQSFRRVIERRNLRVPAVILLNNRYHWISVSYDPIKRSWLFIDANRLRTRRIYGDGLIAKYVCDAFNYAKCSNMPIATDIYSAKNSAQILNEAVHAWKASWGYQKIHSLTEEKVDSKFNKMTLFQLAAINGDISKIEKLLHSYVSANQQDLEKLTPFFSACQNGDLAMVELLLKAGADINQACLNQGVTALYVACQNGNKEIVELLLKSGADVNRVSLQKFSPLYVACQNGHKEIVELLLKCGADVHQVSFEGVSPLLVASQYGHLEIVEFLLKAKAKQNQLSKAGLSPLYAACYYGRKEIVDLLLNAGANINQTSLRGGLTPIYLASECGQKEIVEHLLNAKVNVNLATENGFVPLHIACEKRQKEIVELLLKAGSDPNYTSLKGRLTPLLIACRIGDKQIVEFLLKAGADVNQVGLEDGFAPLHVACENGHIEIVKFLLQEGANKNQISKEGSTPLSLACKFGHREVVSVLFAAKK